MLRRLAIFALFLSSPFLQAQDFALEQLTASPRHHEWVEVAYGERTVHAFVAYPERADNATAVLVLHENRGLTDWVRSFTDQLAAAGYLAIAPDLLSQFDEDHAKTSDFENEDAARTALYALDPDQITADLKAVQAYAAALPAANGNVAVVGFCWGGSQAFRYATNTTGLSAALVFYGTAPTEADVFARIETPVYGFYGENDQRVNATIEGTQTLMSEAGKIFEVAVYSGAGHAFMRSGDNPADTSPNRQARHDAWERLERILDSIE